MACSAGPHVLLGLAKRGRRGGERAIWEELGDFGVDGFVRGVFAGSGVQLLAVVVKSGRASFFAQRIKQLLDEQLFDRKENR
jgi:hypothetical protein